MFKKIFIWPTTKNPITNVCRMKFKILRRKQGKKPSSTPNPYSVHFFKTKLFYFMWFSVEFSTNFYNYTTPFFFCTIPFQLLFFTLFRQDISLIYLLLQKKTPQSFFRSSLFDLPFWINVFFNFFFFAFFIFLLSIFQMLFSKFLQNLKKYFSILIKSYLISKIEKLSFF